MFKLDRNANDTSLALDLLRAVAAQMVCVGHAINFGGVGSTSAPAVGVLLFFILSGFVIAHTLTTKTGDGGYGLGRYGIERFSRIYCAYFPALLLFAAVEMLIRYLGIEPGNSGPVTLENFVKNLAMLQLYPGPRGALQFGMSGQTTSVAIEFHIYFFVGSLYFLCIGRQRFLAAIVAVISAGMPIAQFLGLEGRGLFILWLLGFALYFVVRSIRIDRSLSAALAIATIGVIYWCWPFVNLKDVYDIANFPMLTLLFALLVVATQSLRILASAPSAGKLIHFFAGYSLTLFLVHLVLIRALYLLWPDHGWTGVVLGIIGCNLFAAAFAQVTEIHYHRVADWIMKAVGSAFPNRKSRSEEQPRAVATKI